MKADFGDRILARLYRYQAYVVVVSLMAVALSWMFIVTPRRDHDRLVALSWLADRVLAQSDRPEALAAEVKALDGNVPVTMTVFRADGTIVATNEPRPHVLDPALVARIDREHAINLDCRYVALDWRKDGRPVYYAIVGAMPWALATPLVLLAIVLFLVAVAAAAVPAAKSVARPLEELARVTRSFGLGDLGARAAPHEIVEIGDVARAFNQMADRLEVLRCAEKELLANVSHELRTPLARIRVVLEHAAEEEPAAAKRHLETIAEDVGEVEQILYDIIRAARIDAANKQSQDPFPELRLARLPLGSVLDAVVRRFATQHPGRRLAVDVAEPIVIDADRVMLKHALSNLLDNAAKYSPSDTEIRLYVERGEEDGEVRIAICDRGIGISGDDLDNVFTPFFRADRSRTRETGGVGLGLVLTKRVVEAHGGTIAIASRLGMGTEVTMTLTTALSREARDEASV